MTTHTQIEHITGGYILLARRLLDSNVMIGSPIVLKLWVWLLLKANHQTYKAIERGQVFTTIEEMRSACAYKVGYRLAEPSKDQIRSAYEALTKTAMITTTKTTRGLIITICNYDYYQNPKNYETHNEKATKTLRSQSAPHTIYKNVKNDNNDNNKKDKKLFLEFVYLSEEENKKLLDKFGEAETAVKIEKLNNYIGSKGARYRSHYHTILNWANRDKEKPLIVASTQKTATSDNPSLDLNKSLSEKLGRIATKDMIKSILREIPQELWWKVDNFLKKRYPGGGNGFAEAEREVIAEARQNREDFKKLTEGIGK
ncbi:MAG: hypothetical protein WC357_02845 [Candidatus Omnitrophota bacterium]|jgi:hypothetical protein